MKCWFLSRGEKSSTRRKNLSEQGRKQPRPQGLLLVQNCCGRNPWPRLLKWLQRFVRILSRKHDEMSSLRLNNVFRLQKTNRAARHWKQPPKKSFHRVSRDKILQDSWSISAALARGFSDRHFEREEGPGDEVGTKTNNKLNARMSPSPGIGPGPHWWKASALTTAPSLLPLRSHNHALH